MTVIENDSPKEFFEGPFEVSDLIPFTFPYADRTDVKVKIGDEVATYGVEYEISAESPSSILVKVNIDSGVQVTIYRETPIDQQSSYPQNSKFRSEQVESDFDKICMIQQEQKEMLIRCLRVPVENIVAFDGELPPPQEGKILVWSDEGKIVNSPSTITEIEDSVNTAVSNAATALSSASGAVLTAESAEQKATTALNQSNTALANSATAVTSADLAVSTANSASADAASAVGAATYAINKVDEFGEDIETVIEAAERIEELEEAIDEAVEAASTAEEAAAQATQAAEEAVQALSTKQDILVSGTNIKTVNSTSLLGSGNIDVGTVTSVNNVQPVNGNVTLTLPDPLPSQTGQAGKYLTTNGTNASWADVDSLPSQTGQAGKYLTTNGTNASWGDLSTRNIGEIVTSTIPLTDAGLHLLDGSLLQYGSYQAFIDYIADLVTDYPSLFCTEAQWQTSVTTYGVCGKFVYDNTNNTVRLPKITGIIEGTTDLTALGDLVKAGLPNIQGTVDTYASYSNFNAKTAYTGAFYKGSSAHGGVSENTAAGGYKLSFNATRSSVIYGNSSTVQPQTIKVLYYIVIATSTKTDIEVDIDEIATDLNNKADKAEVDGQWVDSYLSIASGVSAPTSTALSYSLANYLPNDGYIYEVMFSMTGTTSTSASSYNRGYLYSDIITHSIAVVLHRNPQGNSVSTTDGGTAIIPIGSERKIYISPYANNAGTLSLVALCYRRIGTNS